MALVALAQSEIEDPMFHPSSSNVRFLINSQLPKFRLLLWPKVKVVIH